MWGVVSVSVGEGELGGGEDGWVVDWCLWGGV